MLTVVVILLACPGGRLPDAVKLAAEVLARMDRDGDGRVSASEYAPYARHEGEFTRMDADGDGFVTPAEFDTFVAAAP